jgi:hypothetical protein
MFEISLSWINGLFQVATYSAVICGVLFLMSKIQLGERPQNKREGER